MSEELLPGLGSIWNFRIEFNLNNEFELNLNWQHPTGSSILIEGSGIEFKVIQTRSTKT